VRELTSTSEKNKVNLCVCGYLCFKRKKKKTKKGGENFGIRADLRITLKSKGEYRKLKKDSVRAGDVRKEGWKILT